MPAARFAQFNKFIRVLMKDFDFGHISSFMGLARMQMGYPNLY